MKRILQLICAILVFSSGTLFAQPANDNCSGAESIMVGADEASVVLVAGDTRGATGDANVPNVCSGSWFADDIWFSFVLPADVADQEVVVKAYFGTETDDVPAVGMGLYESCGMDATPISCFSSADPLQNNITLSTFCLEEGKTYYVRVWSGVSPTDNSGTLRMGAYMAEPSTDIVLWEETFADSLDGWNTFGTCGNLDSNEYAVWSYLPNNLLDKGSYAAAGYAVNGPTFCNGSVGVDSDFDDTNGEALQGVGRCIAPAQYILESPALASGDWDVAGLTITWTQAIRQYQSTYFVSYRTAATGGNWGDWVDFEVNTEFELNSAFFDSDVVRIFMGGAAGSDSLQIRFVYNANYYLWGIDDVRIVATEANNMRSMSNFYAISPSVVTPTGQTRDWFPLNDVANVGALEQTNVNLNLTILDSGGGEIYNENVDYGSIPADSTVENINFATAVSIDGNTPAEYTGTYTVTSDSCQADTDFDFSDNQNSFTYSVNDTLYSITNGNTTAFNINSTLYDDGAPLSFTWGTYMMFPNGSEATVDYIRWGISNPDAIPGGLINIILFKWVDLDENQIVQANEREPIGFASVAITGTEGDNSYWNTVLENFNSPGDPITLEDGGEYLAMVEYNATDVTGVFIMASEEHDYAAVQLSSEQAGTPTYFGVLGFSPDGNIQGIDYEVKEFGDDGRAFFGFDANPDVSMILQASTGIKDDLLSSDNLVEVFPNPADHSMTVKLEFADVHDEMQLQIYDVTGKLIESRNLNNVLNETFNMNVSQYANGAYILKVQTEAGSRTERFVVQH